FRSGPNRRCATRDWTCEGRLADGRVQLACYCHVSRLFSAKAAKMSERDAMMCGICSEPFKDGEVAIQAIRRWTSDNTPAHLHGVEKFWAHAVCVFSGARETEGPSEKHKPR